MKNMFAAPKTADVVTEDPIPPVESPPKEEIKEIPFEVIGEKIDDITKFEGQIATDLPHIESHSKPPIKQKKEKKVVAKPTQPENDAIKKVKAVKTSQFEGPKVHIGCRVSNEMKNAIEDMAKDFAYLARKEYGLKIKDDASFIQRAFLILGMSCFTESIRHKILQDYDNESLLQDEVSQQLLALMKIHNVKVDDMDF